MYKIILPIILSILLVSCAYKEQSNDKDIKYKGFNHKPSIKMKTKRDRS